MRLRVIFVAVTVIFIQAIFACSLYAKEAAIMQRTHGEVLIPDAMDVPAFEKSYKRMESRIDMKNDIESETRTMGKIIDTIDMPLIDKVDRDATARTHIVKQALPHEVPTWSKSEIQAARDVVLNLTETKNIYPAEKNSPPSETAQNEGPITLSDYLEAKAIYGGFSSLSLREQLVREKVLYPAVDDEVID